jgi:hypothetical protein
VRDVGFATEKTPTHAYLNFDQVRVPADHMLGGRGEAFVVAQVRLGGGRIHHAMRTIGEARRALDMMCERVISRRTQGERLADKQMVQERLADSWIELEQFRLLVLRTAWLIDKHKDYKKVRKDISAVKAAMPKVLHDIASRALLLHGFPEAAFAWDGVLQRLAPRHAAVAPADRADHRQRDTAVGAHGDRHRATVDDRTDRSLDLRERGMRLRRHQLHVAHVDQAQLLGDREVGELRVPVAHQPRLLADRGRALARTDAKRMRADIERDAEHRRMGTGDLGRVGHAHERVRAVAQVLQGHSRWGLRFRIVQLSLP